MRFSRSALIQTAHFFADVEEISASLVCAVIEQESDWNTWAWNPEPEYRYLWDVAKNRPFRKLTEVEKNSNTPPQDFPCLRGEDRDAEWQGQRASWGLMQVMGAVARECGYSDPYFPRLCDPFLGIKTGCIHLARKLRECGGDQVKALLRWNGGGDPEYARKVMARVQRYC